LDWTTEVVGNSKFHRTLTKIHHSNVPATLFFPRRLIRHPSCLSLKCDTRPMDEYLQPRIAPMIAGRLNLTSFWLWRKEHFHEQLRLGALSAPQALEGAGHDYFPILRASDTLLLRSDHSRFANLRKSRLQSCQSPWNNANKAKLRGHGLKGQ